MKLKELIEKIQGLDLEAEVIISDRSDFASPLSDVKNDGIYIADTTWEGCLWHASWSASDALMEEEEWEEFKKRPRCIVLYPTC